MISEVNSSLQAMGLVQYLLALLFLMSYPLALTSFAGPRGRAYAALMAAAAATGFVGFTAPWEHGVLLVAMAVLAIGAFAAAVWLLDALLARLEFAAPRASRVRAGPAAAPGQVPLAVALHEAQAGTAAPHEPARSGALPIA